jgi:outer membrane protein TolC
MFKMKKMKWPVSFAFTLLIFLLLSVKSSAQAPVASIDSLLKKAFITDELLPMLIDSAIKYSPLARIGRSNETRIKATHNINKRSIYNALSIRTSLGYGSNFSAVNNQSATISENYTTGSSAFYSVGVGLQLPLNQLINRKDIIKVERSIVEAAVADKDNTIQTIKHDVIKAYQDLKLIQKLLTVSSKNRQAAEINFTLAEKNFLNGQLTVDQVSLVTESYNKAVIDFETNKIKFQTSFMELEEITGTNLSILIMLTK